MTVALPLALYEPEAIALHEAPCAAYWYEGRCPSTGDWLRLPRSPLAESVARRVMDELAVDPICSQEGKMYGVLLAATATAEIQVLKAFSGTLQGQTDRPGWVPPLPARQMLRTAETETLQQLEQMKQQLQELHSLPIRQQYAEVKQSCDQQRQQLSDRHRQRQHHRQQQRVVLQQTLPGTEQAIALETLDQQSRQDGSELRHLKRQHRQQLQPLEAAIAQADAQMRQIKQARKQLSRSLQSQLHEAYQLTNFAGEWRSLPDLNPHLPSGTGDCCAPKLLYYAATHQLTPLAMAEFWWGPSQGDRVAGRFYEACADRCQPLMGFMLSGLSQAIASQPSLPILYEDDWLVAVDKPAGLLSVPGRTSDRQDSVLSRLRSRLPHVTAVHRLDQDTSGVLLLAKTPESDRALRQQFQARQVRKIYAAIVIGHVATDQGHIDLPLQADPDHAPRQLVHPQGKTSHTHYRVIERQGDRTRLEFAPITGRTHQLRVHSAQGLGCPIWGDRLYGGGVADRLHLHAHHLTLCHPHRQTWLTLSAPLPF